MEEATQVKGWVGLESRWGEEVAPTWEAARGANQVARGQKWGVKCLEASPMSDILNINTLTPLAAAITSSKTKLTLSELSTVDFDPLKNL